jgi:hypothetical protein
MAMLRTTPISMLAAISLGLLMGFASASFTSPKKLEPLAAPDPEPISSASLPFVDNSGLCCPDDLGCTKNSGRALLLTTAVTDSLTTSASLRTPEIVRIAPAASQRTDSVK